VLKFLVFIPAACGSDSTVALSMTTAPWGLMRIIPCVYTAYSFLAIQSNWVAIVQGCLCNITTTSTAGVQLDSVVLKLSLANVDYDHQHIPLAAPSHTSTTMQSNAQVCNKLTTASGNK
jgi:hypothetical protein